MCDRLVEEINEVDGEMLEGMLEGWRGVEQGGRSLKDACERLLEERVRCIILSDYCVLRLDTTGPFTQINGRHRSATRVFQGTGIRNAYAQPPG
jgi:hypothetical protein